MALSDPDADATSHQYDTHMETGKGNAIGQNARVTNYHYGLPQPQGSLEAYFDKMDNMKESLLKKNILGGRNKAVINTARALTLRILPSLDKAQKKQVLQYLYDSKLIGVIENDKPIIPLDRADLSRADLSRAELGEANLREANLYGASIYRANLSEANLSFANLSGANLSFANLSEANLGKANLSGTSFYEANLREANLGEANLSGALLIGANLMGATFASELDQATLSQCKSLKGAIMPDGSKHS